MRRNRSIGFTLLEVMMTVALVGLAFPLATSLIRITLRADRGFADSQGAATRFDGATNALRQDIWNAGTLSAVGDHDLTVGQADTEAIHWRSTADGTLERETTGASPRTWALDHQLFFKVDGPTLNVSSPSDRDGRGVAMTFISQRLVARKGGT